MKLPPEWWPQSAVMLTWPQPAGDWGAQLSRVEACFFEIGREILKRQDLIISAPDSHCAQRLQQEFSGLAGVADRLRIEVIPSNDVWVRDHGPICLIDTEAGSSNVEMLNFQFNGWGGKYPAALDNAINRQLHTLGVFGSTPMQDSSFVLEGGAIDTNGEGAILTTEDCLTLPSRNPGCSQSGVARLFEQALGCTRVHWLPPTELAGDDTDGHIDTLARFTDPRSIVYQACDNPEDEHYEPLQLFAAALGDLADASGQAYRLRALPMPAAIYNAHGQRLPASYANFLIINSAVLMPSYADPADTVAAKVLQTCFPDRDIVSIDCRALVEQFGSLHCATMQLPLGAVPQSP